jgi:hypothetical protein
MERVNNQTRQRVLSIFAGADDRLVAKQSSHFTANVIFSFENEDL